MLSIVRQHIKRPVQLQRFYLHSSSIVNNQAAAAATPEAQIRKPSSVTAGTPLKGINFLKEGKDPIALEDQEYPMWLWDLLDEKKQKQKTTKPSNRQYHRKNNRDAIKSANFMKDKKT
ncbi:unnamed protein product [Cunninghamella blakesleeana]